MIARLYQALDQVRPDSKWTRQAICEGDGALVFERCWRYLDSDDPNPYRLHVHRIPPQRSNFWHAHTQPIGVLVLGGPYELRIGHGSEAEVGCVLATGPFAYELAHPESWHNIQTHGTVHSVMLAHTGRQDRWRASPAFEGPPPAVPSDLVARIDEIINARFS